MICSSCACSSRCSSIVFLGILLFSLLFCVLEFLSGFILLRHEFRPSSSCDDFPEVLPLDSRSPHNCLLSTPEPTYDHVLLFLIDGIRFDVLRDELPLVQEYITDPTKYSGLRKLIADAPTTTSCRIEGLTAGTVPTYFKIGKTFDSDELMEDSLIHQLASHDKRVVFNGDDGWCHLFPNDTLVSRKVCAHAFNNYDIYSVDEVVEKILFPEISLLLAQPEEPEEEEKEEEEESGEEWDITFDPTGCFGLDPVDSPRCRLLDSYDEVLRNFFPTVRTYRNSSQDSLPFHLLISHFMGLDHAGHRYGIHHPKSHEKVLYYDSVLRQVIDTLPADGKTLLLVFGDHGIMPMGDHGGSSRDEVETGLFWFVKGKEVIRDGKSDQYDNVNREILQIDLVPTLALLMGVPIPFSNLGSIIPELIPEDVYEIALELNAAQVKRFVMSHDDELEISSREKIMRSEEERKKVNEMYQNQEFVNMISFVEELCRRAWNTYDEEKMLMAIFDLLAVSCVGLIGWFFSRHHLSMNQMCGLGIAILVWNVIGSFSFFYENYWLLGLLRNWGFDPALAVIGLLSMLSGSYLTKLFGGKEEEEKKKKMDVVGRDGGKQTNEKKPRIMRILLDFVIGACYFSSVVLARLSFVQFFSSSSSSMVSRFTTLVFLVVSCLVVGLVQGYHSGFSLRQHILNHLSFRIVVLCIGVLLYLNAFYGNNCIVHEDKIVAILFLLLMYSFCFYDYLSLIWTVVVKFSLFGLLTAFCYIAVRWRSTETHVIGSGDLSTLFSPLKHALYLVILLCVIWFYLFRRRRFRNKKNRNRNGLFLYSFVVCNFLLVFGSWLLRHFSEDEAFPFWKNWIDRSVFILAIVGFLFFHFHYSSISPTRKPRNGFEPTFIFILFLPAVALPETRRP